MKTRGLALVVVVVLGCSTGSSGIAQARQATASETIPDLSGGWLLIDTSGSGSFDGTQTNLSKPVLTPAAQAMGSGRGNLRNLVPPDGGNAPAHEAGDAYIVSSGACTPEGTGGSAIEPNSTAVFLLQSKDEVLLVREGPGGRHFFMDGRHLPDPASVTPSMYGHSVGRYEGSVLVVETVGLSAGTVPGGGRRRPETRLTERFQRSPDGKRLTVTYTWDDPVIYVRPYVYEHVFERLPPGSYALETWCDSNDPLQRQSIVPPRQGRGM